MWLFFQAYGKPDGRTSAEVTYVCLANLRNMLTSRFKVSPLAFDKAT